MEKGFSRNWAISLRFKLAGAFVFVALLVAMTSGLAYTYLQKVDTTYTELLQRERSASQQVAGIKEKNLLQTSLLFGYVLEPNKDKQQMLMETNAALTAAIAEMGKAAGQEEEQTAITAMMDANQTFARLVQKVVDYASKGDTGLAKAEAMQWAIPTTETLKEAAGRIEEIAAAEQTVSTARNHEIVAATMRTLIGVSAAALVLAAVIGLLLARAIVGPLKRLVRAAQALADGDLTIPDVLVSSRDELRQLAGAFNAMKGNLHSLIRMAGLSSDQVAAASEELSANAGGVSEMSERVTVTVQLISAGTGDQVRSVQEGVAMMEEMAAAVDQITAVALSAKEGAAGAQLEAGDGTASVERAVAQMQAIHRTMQALFVSVERLGLRVESISSANAMIAAISRQTNMLALNASIEAARAGAAGRGFAVVADEVRKLSLQTSAAAGEVAELISHILGETEEVRLATEAGSREVATGLTVVSAAGATFARIRGAMDGVAQQIAEVSASAASIAARTGAAVGVIRAIDDIAGETANGAQQVAASMEGQHASMEEIVSAAAVLNAMAAELQERIGQFRV
ncbi:methyl-accepting chemotaxis protein [Paenibacillus whitsoniae]|uniref:Methyl-accepting chemotaxis protein n=1 Tax=Paenibacillus whitsoniae TaxID=2496558 RepID=A0A3S0CRG8_9BACL|nr:methyl-accepting chemotaxis protein [Paenibacillus whitsoniae]RTE05610.1 methyl-accepting chemotaxis protein [Paenibacillus whitsoniae]